MATRNDEGRIVGQDHHKATHTNIEIEQARQLRAEGWSLGEIAKKLDSKKSTVQGWINGTRRTQTATEDR